jgi:hypothetical protein
MRNAVTTFDEELSSLPKEEQFLQTISFVNIEVQITKFLIKTFQSNIKREPYAQKSSHIVVDKRPNERLSYTRTSGRRVLPYPVNSASSTG